MSKNRLVASLDLGSTKITTLVAQIVSDPVSFENRVNIVGVASVDSKGMRKGQIVDIEEAVEAVIASVEAAERMAGYNLSSAFVSIGGASISSQNSHGVVAVSDPEGEITGADTQRVIEAASAISLPSSRELIHVIPREFIVDGESGVRDPIGMSGVRLEVDTHIVTSSASTSKNLKKCVNEVGITIEDLVFTAIASAESTLTKTEKELGCVLVDVGGGTTSVSVFIEGSLVYSSVLPIGAKNVTNDLAIGLRVSLENAEKIKLILSEEARKSPKKDIKAGSEKDVIDLTSLGIEETKKVSRKTLIEGIIRPRLNEIFTMVRIQLEKEGLRGKVPSGVIVTGGGAETVGVEESVKRMMSLPVRIGVPKGVGGLIDDILNPSYAASIGLLLYALKNETPKNMMAKKSKLPASFGFSKIVQSIKDLLP